MLWTNYFHDFLFISALEVNLLQSRRVLDKVCFSRHHYRNLFLPSIDNEHKILAWRTLHYKATVFIAKGDDWTIAASSPLCLDR